MARLKMVIMDWEDRLDDWELDLELGERLDGSDWVTLEKAAAETGASRAALRTWYRSGQIPSRLVAPCLVSRARSQRSTALVSSPPSPASPPSLPAPG